MKRFSLRAIVLLVLLAGLAVAPPAAAESRSGPAFFSLASAFERLWGFLSIFQTRNGCILDPDGTLRCEPAPATAPENGCIIDPNGVRRCKPEPAATSKNGCQIDPNGVPRREPAAATAVTENGCRIALLQVVLPRGKGIEPGVSTPGTGTMISRSPEGTAA